MSFPLSADQAALWYADERTGDGPAAHIAHAVEVTGPLDVAVFRSCWERLVERHDSLRTRFGDEAGVPHQVIVAEAALDLVHEDVNGRSTDEVREALLTEATRPFDLATTPPLRLRVYCFAPDRHWVLWAVHPIVADARSLAVLVAEFGQLYTAARQGRAAALEPAVCGYEQALARQREWRHGPEAERLLGRISGGLRSAPPLSLSCDLPGPTPRSARGVAVTRIVPASLAVAVQEFCAERGIASGVFLNTVYQLLLHLRSGQDRIVVGMPATSRAPGQSRMVGCFVNTVPIALDFAGDPSFDELLTRAGEATAAAHAARRVPFADVVARVGARRDGARTPLVHASFTHLTTWPGDALSETAPFVIGDPHTRLQIGDLTVRPLPPVRSVTAFEWDLTAVEEQGRLVLSLRFDDGLSLPATAQSLLDHLTELLGRVLAEPEQPVSAHPRATRQEADALAAWNSTDRDYDSLPWVHDSFRQQVARTPDAVALRHAGRSVTYRDLDRRVNAMAGLLREHGVGPGTVVGVAVERSVELVVSLLGTLAAGAAYLPLDPDYPAERVSFMVEDSAATLVLSRPHLREQLPDMAVPIVWLEDGEPSAGSLERVEAPVHPGTVAYVMYTSGSTGRPKGTLITHAALRNRIAWMQDQYWLTPDDRVLQKTPSSFDVSVWEFFWPLTQGACLVLAQPGGQRDVAYLAEVIRAERITTVHFVPSVLRLFLADPSADRCTSLRRMFCSGEALPLDVAEAVLQRLPCELHNLYGPTEATVDVTWWPCRSGDGVVPIGFPVANTIIHVLDGAGRPLPPGVTGEIHIGGVQLAHGYLNRPGLTAERFVPDPFAAATGARLYRTGDIGRYRPDGAIEFLGRVDHQLKLHGNRVEIGEIETCLSAHPEVRAAVVTVTHRSETAALEGHVVAVDGAQPDTARLTAHLREHLPAFMVPGRITLLERLPLTPSGKADRKALQASADPVSGPAAGARRTAGSPGERTVARAVAEVLGMSDVGVDDDFFDLGGMSSDVLRLRALLARAGLDVSVRDILRRPTAEGIAHAVHPLPEKTAPWPEPFALLTPDDRAQLPPGLEDAFPLTGPLRELVLSEQRGTHRWYEVLVLRFGGEFSEPALRDALDTLAARHAVLRTSFVSRGVGEPLQLVRPRAVLPLRVHDVTALPPGAEAAQTDRAVTEIQREAVDFSRGPLLRAEAVASGDSFTLVLGHPGFDRWSLELLAADLVAGYAASADGREPSWPTSPSPSGAHLVALERRPALGTAGTASDDDPPAGEACLLPRPTGAGGRHGAEAGHGTRTSAAVPVPGEVRDGLLALARASGFSLRTVFLAAHMKVIAALGGRTTATAGVITNCRPLHVAAERFAGAFNRVLPLRVDLGAGSWRELVGGVARAEHEVRTRLRTSSSEAVPAYDTAFDHVDFAPHEALGRRPGPRLLEWRCSSGQSPLPLTASWRPDGATGEPVLVLDSDEETADARRLAEIAECYARVLAAMATGPDGPCDVDVRSDRERAVAESLLAVEEPSPDPGPVGAHLRVAQVAARLPDATALQYADHRLSYAQLDAAADALAARIRAAGTPPGGVVAVVGRPSAELPVAMLAVLRAGAAYLPIAPHLDTESVRRVIVEAEVSAIVGDGAQRLASATAVAAIPLPPPCGEVPAGAAPDPGVAADATACVVPAAGGDAFPPGVDVSHAALDAALRGVRHELSWQDEAEVLVVVPSPRLPPIGPELLLALTTGARLVLATAEEAQDPGALDGLLIACGATTMLAAPDIWQAFVRSGWPGDPALRIVCHGAVPSAELRTSLSRAGRVAWSLYGHGETGLWSMATRLDDDTGTLLGRPLPHVGCRVVGADGRPVPFGVPGELYIGGRGLSRGFRGRPDLDARPFVTLPGAAGRLFRTGERVHIRPDGVIESLSTYNPEGSSP